MASFPRPLMGLASALVASSSTSGLLHRTLASTSAFGARSFASSSARARSYKEVQEGIAETEARAKADVARVGKESDKNELAYRTNPQAKAQIDSTPIDMLVYINFPSYTEARKEPGFKTMTYLRMLLGAKNVMLETRSYELGFPMKTTSRFLGQYAGYFAELKAFIGLGGPIPQKERELVDSLARTYVSFREAELRGNAQDIAGVTEAPMRAKVLRDIKIKPRSARVARGKWEIVQHIERPKFQSLFRLPIMNKRTLSHCLIRFNTVQQITLPPKASDPAGEPLVKQTTIVENVLFERRDWLCGASNTTQMHGSSLKAPWKVKAIVGYDDVDDMMSPEPVKKATRSEMEGFGSP